ncbi:hypothetical protein [Geodermatophilus sp. URMC 63]
MRSRDGEQVHEPVHGGRHEKLNELAAEAIEQHGGVFVLVCIDADDDIVATQQHSGHGRGLLTDHGRAAGRVGGQDCDGTCCDQAEV